MSIAFRFKDLVLPTLFCLLLSGAWGQPKISSFSPTSGPVGSTVTISGTNFSPTVANNMVYFGQIRASVNSASSSSLVVTVPSGASFQPITVTTGGLTAYSRNPFVVTFPGASLVFSTQSFAYVTKLDSIDGLSETTKYTVGDLDGDGKMDVVTLDRLNNTLAVYRNVTNGGMIEFTSRLDFPTGQTPRSATIADLDGDGRADIAVSDFSDNTVSILRNTTVGGNLSFAGRVDFPTFTQPGAIAVADVDGDIDADFID